MGRIANVSSEETRFRDISGAGVCDDVLRWWRDEREDVRERVRLFSRSTSHRKSNGLELLIRQWANGKLET